MADEIEIARLLSQLRTDRDIGNIRGTEVFERLLAADITGSVLRVLEKHLPELEGNIRRVIAWTIAKDLLAKGDLKAIQRIFDAGDGPIKECFLGALCSDPHGVPGLGEGIVAMAVEATGHPAAAVRGAACVLFQNQSDWGIDVSSAVGPLVSLLCERAASVRQPAAYAVGNLAKKKYDLSRLLTPLRRNLKHKDQFVREPSAWALAQMSRFKRDIGAAVPELAQSLTADDEWDGPRKQAAAALLHHARKSSPNATVVKGAVKGLKLDTARKEIKKFLDELARAT